MARSASDATRFTATGPTAYTKPASNSTIQHLGRGAIPGETPQQKITRLRAAAAAARAGKESNFDRVVRTGRKVADKAHRFTAYTLIGLTVASGIVAGFAISDMLLHNRNKRNEWLANQQANHRAQIQEARALLEQGKHITEDQMLLLNQERAAQEAYEMKKNKKGIFSRAKEAVFSSVPEEETKGGKLNSVAQEIKDAAQNKAGDLGITEAVQHQIDQGRATFEQGKQKLEQGLDEVERKASDILEKGPVVKVVGGPLDREAQAATDAIKAKSKSWTDWVLRR